MNEYPNRIDQIIRKNTDGRLDNVIAEFFRRHNIVEFKSVRDRFNIGSCLRALAYPLLLCDYGCSYMFGGEQVTERVSHDDVTLTIVRNAHPGEVISFLSGCCGRTVMPHAGVYRFENFGCVPVQIIVLNEMDDEQCMFLRSVTSGRLPEDAAEWLGENLSFPGSSPGGEADDAERRSEMLIRFLFKHHRELFKEGMKLYELAEEIVAPKIKRLVAEGEARGKAIGEAQGEARGETRGMFNTLFGLVRDGILSMRDAAERAKVTADEFSVRMNAWTSAHA